MTVVPGFTPVTTPPLFIVATPVLEELQGVAVGVPVPVKEVVDPSQTVKLPLIVGCASTVTVTVLLHPVVVVYVMTVVPGFTPVTMPALFMVATPVLEELQGVAVGVPVPVNVVDELLHIVKVPLIVGCASTVTVTVLLHPLVVV